MVRLCAFYGITIHLHWREHPPPHLHAWYGGQKASIRIADGELLEGRLPPRARILVKLWVTRYKRELEENWQRAQRRLPPIPIPPLE